MSMTTFPTTPTVGQTHAVDDKLFAWDGSVWLAVGHVAPDARVFSHYVWTTPGTYTFTPSAAELARLAFMLRAWGGGGGGATSLQAGYYGGGGGGGAYGEVIHPMSIITARATKALTITVGAGGAAGANGGQTSVYAAGGNSLYDRRVNAYGGGAGMPSGGGTGGAAVNGHLTPTQSAPTRRPDAIDPWNGGGGAGGDTTIIYETQYLHGGYAIYGGGGGKGSDISNTPPGTSMFGSDGLSYSFGTPTRGGGGTYNGAGGSGCVEVVIL